MPPVVSPPPAPRMTSPSPVSADAVLVLVHTRNPSLERFAAELGEPATERLARRLGAGGRRLPTRGTQRGTDEAAIWILAMPLLQPDQQSGAAGVQEMSLQYVAEQL